MKVNLLGVKIDDISKGQTVTIVKEWLKEKRKHYIVTPNPEIVVMAQKDKELIEVLNQASLAIPDGVGLKLSGDIVCNTPGIDVLESLVKLSADLGFTTGFLGGGNGIAEKASERLQKKYKNLKVSFAAAGGGVNNEGQAETEIKVPSTDILFVAFGPPKQEKWIAKNLDKLDVKVAMGVGGAFDVICGRVPRAPKLVRNLGLEWLFRLIVQPWRFKRQLALVEFIWLLISKKRNVIH